MKVFLVCMLACLALSAYGIAPLHRVSEKIKDKYLVGLNDDVDVGLISDRLQKALSSRRFRIGRVLKTFKAVRALSLELSDDAVEFVRKFDGIAYIEEDGMVRTQGVAWGLDRIDQASSTLDGRFSPVYTGKDMRVYVVDTGILPTHEEFGGRATIFYDALGGDGVDCNGHGTHCAGTVGGSTYGVAKDVNIFGVRVLSCIGFGSNSGIIDGMDIVAKYGNAPAVVSMSLGGGASITSDNAVARLKAAGFIVSVAAGNDNADASNYSPARSPDAITVGAAKHSTSLLGVETDVRASFSNYGSAVDIFAPGQDITSAWYTSDTATNTISGTSMACPHVSGVLALLLEEFPNMSTDAIRDILLNDATPDVVSDCQGSANLMLHCLSWI